MDLAVVLVSGGLGSAVTLAMARQQREVAAMFCDYSQRSAEAERKAFEQLTAHYQLSKTTVLEFPALAQISRSALTDPDAVLQSAQQTEGALPNSYLRWRNTLLVVAAAVWADAIGAKEVHIGFYGSLAEPLPDATFEHVHLLNQLLSDPRRPGSELRVVAPLSELQPREVASLAGQLQVPLEQTVSCLAGSGKACWKCDGCLRRAKALREAGLVDPLLQNGQPVGKD